MDPSVSLALTGALFFLILSSSFAITLVRRTLKLTDDMSLVGRTVIFGLIMMQVARM